MLTLAFTIEILLKLIAYTPGEFFGDGFNTFDFFIVTTGMLDLLSESMGSEGGGGVFQAFRIFRLFRVLRVLRLINFLEPLQKIGRVVAMTIGKLAYISCLLLLFTYIFTILGMQLFGGKFEFNGETPRANFDTFIDAFVTTVQVLTFVRAASARIVACLLALPAFLSAKTTNRESARVNFRNFPRNSSTFRLPLDRATLI